jgi:hypothetical protein
MTIIYQNSSSNETLMDKYKRYQTKCKCNALNNGIMNGVMPMPQKFEPSDGNETFALNRKSYIENVSKNYNRPLYTRKELNKKGGIPLNNNTSSTVTEMKRIAAIGKSSTKYGQPVDSNLSFKSVNNNTVRNAKRRIRSSGYVVPPKVFNN